MKTKICYQCKVEKKLEDFHRFKHSKDGHKSVCKKCISEYNKTPEIKEKRRKNRYEWGIKNQDKIHKYKQNDYNKNKEKILNKNKLWRLNNPEKVIERHRKYYSKNINKIKEHRKNNREKINKKLKEWQLKNIERVKQLRKKYNSSEKGLTQKRNYYHKTKDNDKHIIAWRSLLHNTIKRFGTKKVYKTVIELGYSAMNLKENMEKKFESGMSWDNWGDWHIDHIKPVSSFDKTEKQSVVNHLDNLQPMWWLDNLKKSNKY